MILTVIDHVNPTKSIDEVQDPVYREVKPLISSLPGLHECSLVKEAGDRASVLIVWDNEADAVNGGNAIGPT